MHLVRSGAVAHFEQLVLELGDNPIQIMQQVGLRQAQFRDPNTYVAYSSMAELLEVAAQRCQQPLFGALLAQRQSIHVLGDLPLIVARASTIEEALKLTNEAIYLHASGVSLKIKPIDDWVQLILTIDIHSHQGIEQLMQLSVGHLAIFIASLQNIKAQHVPLHLCQNQPDDLSEEILKQLPNIKFHETFDGVLIKAKQLSSPNYQNEEALSSHLQQHLQYLKDHYPTNLADQTQVLICRLLPTGECSIHRTAAALGIHERTLQIKLKESETSYRELLQKVRQNLAEQHLRNGILSITELALQLGYAEVAVFSRHFRHWTGLSPRQWQKMNKKKT